LLAATTLGCAAPLSLTWVDVNGIGEVAGQAVLDRPSMPLVVCLGFAGTRAGTSTILGRWVAASRLHLSADNVPRQILLFMLPPACSDFSALDWARVSPWS
jgi:hypothetical protein